MKRCDLCGKEIPETDLLFHVSISRNYEVNYSTVADVSEGDEMCVNLPNVCSHCVSKVVDTITELFNPSI